MRLAAFLFCLALLTGMVLALIPSPAVASDYADGYVGGDYTYRDGFWWAGGYPYTREKVYSTAYTIGYNHYGQPYYVPSTTWEWRYTRAAYYRDKGPEMPKPTDPGWRAKLLEIAAYRNQAEAKLRASAQETAEFQEWVNTLGLTGNFRWDGFGREPYRVQGVRSSYAAFGEHGLTGSTQYGYSTEAALKVYGDTDLNALYQQASLLAQGAQGLAGQAAGDHAKLTQQAADGAARSAEIIAKGIAIREAARAMNAAPSADVKVTTSGAGSTAGALPGPPAGGPLLTAPPDGNALAAWKGSAERCAACHNEADRTKNHGFTLADYPRMKFAERVKVWARLHHPDPKKRMPPDPAKPLTEAEFREWVNLPSSS
jgi:hypothetical protein